MARSLREEDVFVALASEIRREMLELLKTGPKAASELAEPFGVSFPAISQQLGVLKTVGLVSESREGKHRIYKLEAAALKEAFEWLREFQCHWTQRSDPFRNVFGPIQS